KDPRAAFALTPAAVGGPKLRSEIYTGAKLDDQLDAQAHAFMNDATHNQFKKPTARVSPLFQWYKTPRPVLVKYAPTAALPWLSTAKLTYTTFDWHLNGKR